MERREQAEGADGGRGLAAHRPGEGDLGPRGLLPLQVRQFGQDKVLKINILTLVDSTWTMTMMSSIAMKYS